MTLILAVCFLDVSPQAKETKAKVNKWDRAALRSSHVGGDHQQNQETNTEREKAFVNYISKKGLIQKYRRDLYNSISKPQTSQLRNGRKT